MQMMHRSTRQSSKSRRTGRAATPMTKEPSRNFDAAAALAILWVVAMPATAPANTPFSVMVHAHKFAAVARDLLRIGMLRKVRARKGGNWEDAYELAPLVEPLDQGHSEIVRQITDQMVEHADERIVTDLRAVSGLLTKLLGGIDHPDQGYRLEYATQFMG
jgi:hypothetical protein